MMKASLLRCLFQSFSRQIGVHGSRARQTSRSLQTINSLSYSSFKDHSFPRGLFNPVLYQNTPRPHVLTRIARRSTSTSAPESSSTQVSSNPPALVVHDGMPRYPELSAGGILRLFDYIGTVAFAYTGAVTAGVVAGMDLLGCTIVGTITAVGGGTIRDILIRCGANAGKGAAGGVFWCEESEYIVIAALTAATAFWTWPYLSETKGVSEDNPLIFWADTLGLAAFCVIGAQNGIRCGLVWFLSMFCGIMTATFGGVVRDVLAGRKPRILHSYTDIYAVPAGLGALAYLGARACNASLATRIIAGMSVAGGLRVAARTYDIRLPVYARKMEPSQSPEK